MLLAGSRAHASRGRPGDNAPGRDWPWTRVDAERSAAWTVIGAVALAVCAYATAHSKTYDRELLWTGLGAIALAAAVLGGARWVLGGMRAVRHARRDAMGELSRLTAAEPQAEGDTGRSVYFTSVMSRYHLGSCPFARGKELPASTRAEVGDRRPCEVCAP